MVAPPPVLVSNLGQLTAGSTPFWELLDLAQAFTTGSNGTGYTLTSIELSLVTTISNAAPPTVTLHSGSANGTKVADFTGPSTLDASTTKSYTFTPTGTVTLNASTEYFVVAEMVVLLNGPIPHLMPRTPARSPAGASQTLTKAEVGHQHRQLRR